MFLIGDPHLGREFIQNVPLDRRGEREAMMMKQFEKLMNQSDETTIIVGDLFERPYITFQTLNDTVDVIASAAIAKPSRMIIIMAGNHDLDKATDKRGAFHTVAKCFVGWHNVKVLFEPTIIDDVAFFPWQYEKTAEEQVHELGPELERCKPSVAVGHWDLVSFGDHDDHLCPSALLVVYGLQEIYSGHWHISGDYDVFGTIVHCTGSMQPMTHAEDPEGKLYVTLTKQEYEDADPETLRNRYVRVRLTPGEEVSPPATCLGFKTDLARNSEGREIERVNLGTFDMNEILKQAYDTFEVQKQVQTFITENLNGTT